VWVPVIGESHWDGFGDEFLEQTGRQGLKRDKFNEKTTVIYVDYFAWAKKWVN
jgi:hypothetical protein